MPRNRIAGSEKDFNALVGNAPVTTHPNGVRSATLADGTTVSVRAQRTHGAPTVQITPTTGKDSELNNFPDQFR